MELLCFLLSMTAFLAVLYSVADTRGTKRQIAEMRDALADIKSGNGNRRILAKTKDTAAPLAYEINEIVLSYENRLAALRRMEEANKRLMTSLSHDVRTPLTTLIGYLDAVEKGVVAGAERDEYIAIACRKSRALKEYVDVLFDWFKLNSGEFAVKTEAAEAAELTRTILIDWIPVFEDRQIKYDISIPERPFAARLDPDAYARILNNLIQNVVTHSRADSIRISLQELENRIEVRVSDNGAGIEARDLKHIFERLYKCDGGFSDTGSGLGLSIAYQLTEKMNGTITAESEPEKGTAAGGGGFESPRSEGTDLRAAWEERRGKNDHDENAARTYAADSRGGVSLGKASAGKREEPSAAHRKSDRSARLLSEPDGGGKPTHFCGAAGRAGAACGRERIGVRPFALQGEKTVFPVFTRHETAPGNRPCDHERPGTADSR